MNSTIDVDRTIAEAADDFPALFQLFGGYFHQDWRLDYATPAAALSAFIAEAPPDAVRDAVSELDRLLDAGLNDADLTRLLQTGFDCNYLPASDGKSGAEFLTEVRNALRAQA